MKKDRHSFLDWLRVAAACGVVMLHTVTGVMDTTDMSGFPGEKNFFLGILDLVTWCVPVFLMISGYLFLDPQREISFIRMIRKYCSRIILALFLFGVPYACLELVITSGGFAPKMLWQSVLMVLKGKTWSHMWYLYLILILYVLTPMLKRILSLVPAWTVYLVCLVLLSGSSILPFLNGVNPQWRLVTLPGDLIYLFYYLAGFLLHIGLREDKTAEVGNGRGKISIKIRIIIPGVLALTIAAVMILSRILGYQMRMAYNYPPTVLLSLLLVWTAREGETIWKKGGRVLRELAALSFPVYLIHPVFLNVFYKFLDLSPLSYPVYLSLPVFFAVTLILSVIGAWILRKIPPMKKYVL